MVSQDMTHGQIWIDHTSNRGPILAKLQGLRFELPQWTRKSPDKSQLGALPTPTVDLQHHDLFKLVKLSIPFGSNLISIHSKRKQQVTEKTVFPYLAGSKMHINVVIVGVVFFLAVFS